MHALRPRRRERDTRPRGGVPGTPRVLACLDRPRTCARFARRSSRLLSGFLYSNATDRLPSASFSPCAALPADPCAPLYSTLGSREGFSHWTTTSHHPPLKKLGGLKKPPLHSGDGTRPYGSFSDQRELEPAVEEPEATEANGRTTVFDRLVEARAAARRRLTGKKFVFADDSKHGKQTRNKFVAGAHRGLRRARHRLGVGAQRLSQKIKHIVRPLQMLQFVAILFMNVAHGLTSSAASDFDAFSVPRALAALVARVGASEAFARWMGPFWDGAGADARGASARKTHREGSTGDGTADGRFGEARRPARRRASRGEAREEARDVARPLAGGLGSVSPAKLKEGLKHAKRWSGKLVGGMRRSFSSQEDLRREQCRKVEYLCREGRRLNETCDSAGAVAAFRGAVALAPDDPDLLVCLSKSLSDQVFQEDVFHNHALARALSKEAAEISERAIALRPAHAEAHLSLGAALGRLSMWSDNREKVELSRAIKERCEEAIRLDPSSDLAMHVLGRYEHQMAMLGRIVRLLVRAVYGGSLSPGTLENAEALFRRAIAVAPERLIHRVELGKLLLDVNRPDEALVELRLAVTLPREDINSEHERRDAVRLLRKYWNVEAEVPEFQDPPPTPPPRQRRSFEGVLSPRRSLDEVASYAFEGDSARGSPAESGRESPVDSARGSPG